MIVHDWVNNRRVPTMWLVSHKHAQYLLYHLQPAHKPVEVDVNGNEQIKHEVSAFSSLFGRMTSFQRK